MSEISKKPQDTFGLVGHSEAELILNNSWAQRRMAHAWIVGGPKGIGKATLVYKFSRSVIASSNYLTTQSSLSELIDVESDHPVFKQISAGAHPDLFILKKSIDAKKGTLRNSIVIEDSRKLHDFISHTSASGGWRIAIIDCAEDLNLNAANSLLKIIEEPPKKCLIFIISHKPRSIIPTIRSRCRVLNLGRLNNQEVTSILEQNWPELPNETAAGLVSISDGCPGRAIGLGESNGYEIFTSLLSVFSHIPAVNVELIHQLAEQISGKQAKDNFELLAGLPVWWLSKMIRFNVRNDELFENISAEEKSIFTYLLTLNNLNEWVDICEKLSIIVESGLKMNLDRKVVIIDLLNKLNSLGQGDY